MTELGEVRTRLITDETAAFAIVGYVGEVRGGEFMGHHAGCFDGIDTARAWLRGDREPDWRMEYSLGGGLDAGH